MGRLPSSSDSGSSSPSIEAPSDHDLSDFWHEALNLYKGATGIDLRDESTDMQKRFAGCSSSATVIAALGNIVQDFTRYRYPSKVAGTRIRNALRRIVRLALAVVEVGGEAAAAAVRRTLLCVLKAR